MHGQPDGATTHLDLVGLSTLALPPATEQRLAPSGTRRPPADAGTSELLAQLLRGQSHALEQLVDRLTRLEELVHDLRRQAEHEPPVDMAYAAVVERARLLISWLPSDAVVLVVSRGDEALLPRTGPQRAWHFPRDEDGGYLGRYPATDAAAVIALEAQRAYGATHLLLPAPSTWWLEHYAGWTRHLSDRYTRILSEDSTGVLFDIRSPRERGAEPTSLQDVVDDVAQTGGEPSVLDWTGAESPLEVRGGNVFVPPGPGELLPYLDHTIDVVVVGSAGQVEEARRVARTAVVRDDRVVELARAGDPVGLPSVSVVIPTYNGSAHVARCLRALRETVPTWLDVEVLVVDDGGCDDTDRVVASAKALDPRVDLLGSAYNGGFVDACHRGAAAAQGDVLLFLNNDTVPLPGWLEPVLRTFSEHEGVGAVGGKLVFPDGTLQEAGGVIFSDASGANFGKHDFAPDDPIYSRVREVDYCSGAHLATPRSLWREIGGFDRRFSPAYYEDTDYCSSVWHAGLRVLYQPASVVIHLEGATAGREEDGSGMKRFQAVNRRVFQRKWADLLATRPQPPSHYDLDTWHDLAVRPASRPVEGGLR